MRPEGNPGRTLLAIALTVPGLAALSAVPAVAAPASLTSVASNRFLDVVGNSTTAGSAVAIWDCNGQANQRFRLNANGSVTAVQSSLCLHVTGAATANGTLVNTCNYNGQNNQQWRADTDPGPGHGPTCSVSPVNPGSNAAVRKVLCYLHSQYGNHILAGQEESTWNGGPEYEMSYVQRSYVITRDELPNFR